MDSDRFYLDYNATSPLSPSVREWIKSGDVVFANPASQHSSGKAARKDINEARAKIFSTFGKSEKDTKLIFHSGATEAFFGFTHSFSEFARSSGKKLLVCFTRIDHPSVLMLKERYWGDHVEFLELKLQADLLYDHEANFRLLREKQAPGLIILYHHLWVHNETGHVSALSELTRFKEIPDLYLHVDAVQVPGKIMEWRALGVGDIWSFSAHKFGALKGIGFSLVREEVPYVPWLQGGGQQQGLRGGTENPQGIKSIALALADLEKINVAETMKHKKNLEDFLEAELKGKGGLVKGAPSNSNTLYFYLNEFSSDIALALFDLNGLMLSAGSACSSGAARPSVILKELGMGKVAKNGLRLSLPFEVDEKLLSQLKVRIHGILSKLKS